MENDFPIVNTTNLSKKFSKSLRRSMLYGATDLTRAFFGKLTKTNYLRPAEFWALNDISLKLSRGQALGVIGPNGSGKTTLLSLLAGIYPPDMGSIKIRGRVAALIALGAGFESKYTGLENIFLKGTLLGMSTKEVKRKLDEIIAFSELEEFINTPISNYSAGMRVRLGFSIATASEPELILLDEVLAVGDRNFRAKCFNKVDEMASDACTILVSHNMNLISRICTEILVLAKGKVVFAGDNVSEGIEFYNARNPLDESSEFGMEEIQIRKFSWGNQGTREEDITKFNYLDDMEMKMEICLPQSLVAPRFRLIIFNNNFLPVAETITEMNFPARRENACHSIDIKISRIELVSGQYSISIVIEDSATGRFLKRFHAIKSFEIGGDTFSISPIRLQAEWKTES